MEGKFKEAKDLPWIYGSVLQGMFVNLNEHFKLNPPTYIELETLLSNLYPQTEFYLKYFIEISKNVFDLPK